MFYVCTLKLCGALDHTHSMGIVQKNLSQFLAQSETDLFQPFKIVLHGFEYNGFMVLNINILIVFLLFCHCKANVKSFYTIGFRAILEVVISSLTDDVPELQLYQS
ncbi:Hypothetical predicted protein [Podarcis lilfordi]|uniref:Uncharacterized protein n=1 Tax=Podarcis lilfordi TaxID=74358 RepID=A0AA35L307_9SAUR|nr:Hypothetical predicted protein [Podarcis lilfordi]